MIPILYAENEQDFTTLGLGALNDAISCKVHTVLNGLFELEMQYPVSGKRYNDLAISAIIKVVAEKGGTAQLFDIYSITKPISGIVTVYASHVSSRKQFIPIMPCTASNVGGAFAAIDANAVETNPFTFWTNKTTVASFKITTPCSMGNALGGMSGSILDVYSGEYEFDNFTIKLWNRRGNDNGVMLRYGKNITDIEQEESIANTITGVCPFWADIDGNNVVTLTEKSIDASTASNFPFKRTVVKDFSGAFEEQPTEAQLRTYTQNYITSNNIGIPSVGIDLSYENLADYEEYKDVALLEQVKLGDTVHVYFEPLNITASARVTETHFNALLDKYDKVRIGSVKTSLSTVINEDAAIAKENTENQASALEAAFAEAVERLSGADGGYVVINRNSVTGQPYEILIMDTDDVSTAQNVLRLNMNGLGLSTNGVNGPYSVAITGAGITADSIVTGELVASNGRYSLDLTTGTVNMANAIITGGSIDIETSSATEDKITLSYEWTYEGSRFVQSITISPQLVTQQTLTYTTSASVEYLSRKEWIQISALSTAIICGSEEYNSSGTVVSSRGSTFGAGTVLSDRIFGTTFSGETFKVSNGVHFFDESSSSKITKFIPAPKAVVTSSSASTGYLKLGSFYVTGTQADSPIKFHITGRSTDIDCILEFTSMSTVSLTSVSHFWAYGRFPSESAIPVISSGVYDSANSRKYYEIYMPVVEAGYTAEIDDVKMSRYMAEKIQDITTISGEVVYSSGTPSGKSASVRYMLTDYSSMFEGDGSISEPLVYPGSFKPVDNGYFKYNYASGTARCYSYDKSYFTIIDSAGTSYSSSSGVANISSNNSAYRIGSSYWNKSYFFNSAPYSGLGTSSVPYVVGNGCRVQVDSDVYVKPYSDTFTFYFGLSPTTPVTAYFYDANNNLITSAVGGYESSTTATVTGCKYIVLRCAGSAYFDFGIVYV